MALSGQMRKRKELSGNSPVPDHEFDGELLDGVLSQSEDETDPDGTALSPDESESNLEIEPSGENLSELVDKTETLGIRTILKPDPYFRIVQDANGQERYEYDEIDPVYDSDDTDAQGPVNTVGDIPLSFYDSYPHIGYDINGKKIMRPATGEALDALLDSIELPNGWTGLTDPETGKPLNLSQKELELLRRLQMGEVPVQDHDIYPVWLFRLENRRSMANRRITGYGAILHGHRGINATKRSSRTQATICALEA